MESFKEIAEQYQEVNEAKKINKANMKKILDELKTAKRWFTRNDFLKMLTREFDVSRRDREQILSDLEKEHGPVEWKQTTKLIYVFSNDSKSESEFASEVTKYLKNNALIIHRRFFVG